MPVRDAPILFENEYIWPNNNIGDHLGTNFFRERIETCVIQAGGKKILRIISKKVRSLSKKEKLKIRLGGGER